MGKGNKLDSVDVLGAGGDGNRRDQAGLRGTEGESTGRDKCNWWAFGDNVET